MKKILIRCGKELLKVLLTSILAIVGIETSGCVASGNNSTACFIGGDAR